MISPYSLGVKGQGQLYLNSDLQLSTRTLLSFYMESTGCPRKKHDTFKNLIKRPNILVKYTKMCSNIRKECVKK